jgi:hypothetical protein
MLTEILGIKNLKIVPAMFAYLFYRIDQKTFISYVVDKELVRDRREALRIKDVMRGNGYIMKNCKLYAWACWTARRLHAPMPSAKSFGVNTKDAGVLRKLNLKHLDVMRGTLAPFDAWSLRSFDQTTERLLQSPELRNYIGKFVSKKMSFLMKSFGETRHDLEMQLREAALLSWYKQYPRFDSELHMVNVAKASIHNDGHTMITSLSSKSRQRLQRNDDGTFDALTVDIEALADVAAPPQYGALLHDHLQALEAVSHKLNERAQAFLLCAAGQYHEGLTKFLKIDNTDAAEKWPYPRYMAQVQKFFEVTPAKVERLFNAIRSYSDRAPVMG